MFERVYEKAYQTMVGEKEIVSTQDLLSRTFTPGSEKQHSYIRAKLCLFEKNYEEMLSAKDELMFKVVGIESSLLLMPWYVGMGMCAILARGFGGSLWKFQHAHHQHNLLLEELVQIANWCTQEFQGHVIHHMVFRELGKVLQKFVAVEEVPFLALLRDAPHFEKIEPNYLYFTLFGYKATPVKTLTRDAMVMAKSVFMSPAVQEGIVAIKEIAKTKETPSPMLNRT